MFNILYEPWMGVVDMEGNEKEVGLYDYIVNAHLYRRSAEHQSLAVVRRLQQRLAETVVMDAFEVTAENIADLWDEGSFNKEVLDSYLKKCEEEGVSFDLFDENRPFMQADRQTFQSMMKPNSLKSSAMIDPKNPSGNNKIFFKELKVKDYLEQAGLADERTSYYESVYNKKHAPAEAIKLSFKEYMNSLLIKHAISGVGGTGYVPGLSFVPILYHIDTVSENETLFHSILMNMAYEDEPEKVNSYDKPMWRWDSYESGKKYIEETSVNIPKKMGMFFPVVYIYPDVTSIDEETKTISRIYYSAIKFGDKVMDVARESWLLNHEPSVALLKIPEKENEKPKYRVLSVSALNRTWLDIRTYANTYEKNAAPKSILSVKNFEENFEITKIRFEISAYYISMDQGSYISQGKYQCMMPEGILFHQDIMDATREAVNEAEAIGKNLEKNVYGLLKLFNATVKNGKQKPSILFTIANQYMRYSESMFKNRFIPEMNRIYGLGLNSGERVRMLKNVNTEYVSLLKKKAWQLLRSVPVPFGKSIQAEMEIAKLERKKED